MQVIFHLLRILRRICQDFAVISHKSDSTLGFLSNAFDLYWFSVNRSLLSFPLANDGSETTRWI
jgi:hypothetical protein